MIFISRTTVVKEIGIIAVNACERKPELVEKGIFSCAFVVPNFSMWDKLLNESIADLQCKNYKLS